MRGVAILMVLVVHFYQRELFAPFPMIRMTFGRVAEIGNFGVELFFVLSGFLITGILIDNRLKPKSLLNFYARRSLRIFPLYYSILIVLFIVLPKFVSFDPAAAEMADLQGWLWTYTMNWPTLPWVWDSSKLFWIGHFWSLCVEEHFYLVWPAIIYLVPDRKHWITCVALLCLGMFARCSSLLFEEPLPVILNWLSLRRIDGLAIGSIIAIALRDRDFQRFLPVGARLKWGYLVTGALFGLFVFAPRVLKVPLVTAVNELVVVSLFGLIVVHVVYAAPSGRFSRILSSRVLVAFGKYSYGLYMIHGMLRPQLLRILEPFGSSSMLSVAVFHQCAYYVVAVGISFGVAFISYHVLEKQFLGLKRYFDYATDRIRDKQIVSAGV